MLSALNIQAIDIINHLEDPVVQKHYGLKKTVSLTTAQQWLKELGYCWKGEKHGQYIDGHECVDVVEYRQTTFLPAWSSLEPHLQTWTENKYD
ncbi:hypothetical protein OG21DRAFT_1426170 [Imleria badia]|nr:hypothetical protein OG21DRAFT_1426170 [Imleria badia]